MKVEDFFMLDNTGIERRSPNCTPNLSFFQEAEPQGQERILLQQPEITI